MLAYLTILSLYASIALLSIAYVTSITYYFESLLKIRSGFRPLIGRLLLLAQTGNACRSDDILFWMADTKLLWRSFLMWPADVHLIGWDESNAFLHIAQIALYPVSYWTGNLMLNKTRTASSGSISASWIAYPILGTDVFLVLYACRSFDSRSERNYCLIFLKISYSFRLLENRAP